MSCGKLFFTCSMARAGKSTFARKWRDETGERPRIVVSGDAIRIGLHGQDYIRDSEIGVFFFIDLIARTYMRDGYDVLIDETATTEDTIYRYFLIDPDATPIRIECSVEECIRRAHATGRPYLEPVIRRHHAQLVELLQDWDGMLNRLRAKARYRNTSLGVSDGRVQSENLKENCSENPPQLSPACPV